MKVKELIEKLQKCNPKSEVLLCVTPSQVDGGKLYSVREVTKRTRIKVDNYVCLLDKGSAREEQLFKSVEI